jgi:hypothetical protein
MAKKATIICPHCGKDIHLESLGSGATQGGAKVELPANTLKAARRLRRNLNRETESASYCCEAAFTVSAEELPSEEAFA